MVEQVTRCRLNHATGVSSLFLVLLVLAALCSRGLDAQVTVTQLHLFGTANQVGVNIGPLSRDANGHFFGATESGVNALPGGAVLRFDTNGANPQVVLPFRTLAPSSATEDPIVIGSDGDLYLFYHTVGTSIDGALVRVQPDTGIAQVLITAATAGTVSWHQIVEGTDGRLYALAGLKVVGINRDGTGFSVIHTNQTQTAGPSEPSLLLAAREGELIITDSGGGDSGRGIIYRINPDGTGRKVLVDFGQLSLDLGSYPHQLIQGSDGALYGVAMTINPDRSFPTLGSPIFRVSTDGSDYRIIGRLENFAEPGPQGTVREGGMASSLIEAKSGLLYVATIDGMANRAGGVYRLSKDGSGMTNLLVFPDSYTFLDVGVNRSVKKFLVEGLDGALLGSSGLNQIFRFQPDGASFGTVYDFRPGLTAEGKNPQAMLAAGTNGWLFGTTPAGGAAGLGTVYKVQTDGTQFTTLHAFAAGEGSQPLGGVIVATDGALYGTCNSNAVNNVGSVFRLTQDGSNFQVLRSFSSTGGDGRFPVAPLLEGTDGALYGTTYFGGGAAVGAIYKINKDGSAYSIIQRFTNTISGANPSSRLLEGKDGRLYGTTETNGPNGQGVVFALGKDGSSFTLLHTFGSESGSLKRPQGALVQGEDGVLYGTAFAGASSGFGGVFRLNSDGSSFAVLHEFSATNADGRAPGAGLTFGSDGLLYGVTQFGGGAINGSVFRLRTDGTAYEKLYGFGTAETDGANPIGTLVLGPDQALYGTAPNGGILNLGTVFKVTLTTGPPRLTIASDGQGGAVLRWPQTNLAYRLQLASSLAAPLTWADVLDKPNSSGDFWILGISAKETTAFYRLIQP